MKEMEGAKMRYLACLAVVAAIVLAAPASVWAASDHPGITQVYLEARPSSDCFPASALQQAELEMDFSLLCEDCVVTTDKAKTVDYRLILEDPGFGWKLSIYDGEGHLLETVNWGGPLDKGLATAASVIHGGTLTP